MNESKESFENYPGLPPGWIDKKNEKDPALASEELSVHRTILSNVRSHMANERTQLAYLRTALSLMTFGVTLNRFSVFLHQNKQMLKGFGLLQETAFVGIGMVIVGIAILGWGQYRFKRVEREIETNTYTSSSWAMSVVTILVLLLGGVTTVWLLLSHG